MTREQAIARIMAVWPAQQLSSGRDVLAARLVDALVELDIIALETTDSRFGTITDIFEKPPATQPEAVEHHARMGEQDYPSYIGKRDRS